MSSEFTHEIVTIWNFYQLSVLEFDLSVFEAILSIQKSFNLIEYRELIVKNSLFGNGLNWYAVNKCSFEFDTYWGNDKPPTQAFLGELVFHPSPPWEGMKNVLP